MRVQITLFHKKEFDPDNLAGCQKPILDALVNIHFLADDDREHLELVAPFQVVDKTKNRTVVSINACTGNPQSYPQHLSPPAKT